MNGFSVRLAAERHLASIPGIELEASTLFPDADLPVSVRYQVTEPKGAREALEREMLWVATASNDRPVGFAIADIIDNQACLAVLAVLPDYGRQGIGSCLVRTVMAWACDRSYESLTLVTFRHLPWNAPFYTRLGFQRVDPSEHGPGIQGLIEEEAANGINIADRVVMRYSC